VYFLKVLTTQIILRIKKSICRTQRFFVMITKCDIQPNFQLDEYNSDLHSLFSYGHSHLCMLSHNKNQVTLDKFWHFSLFFSLTWKRQHKVTEILTLLLLALTLSEVTLNPSSEVSIVSSFLDKCIFLPSLELALLIHIWYMWEYFPLLCTVKLSQNIVIHKHHAYIIAETSILYI